MKKSKAEIEDLERRTVAYVSEIADFIASKHVLQSRPKLPSLSDGAMELDLALRELRAEVRRRTSPMPSVQEHFQYLGELRRRMKSDRDAFEGFDSSYPLTQILGELESLVIAVEQLSGVFPTK